MESEYRRQTKSFLLAFYSVLSTPVDIYIENELKGLTRFLREVEKKSEIPCAE